MAVGQRQRLYSGVRMFTGNYLSSPPPVLRVGGVQLELTPLVCCVGTKTTGFAFLLQCQYPTMFTCFLPENSQAIAKGPRNVGSVWPCASPCFPCGPLRSPRAFPPVLLALLASPVCPPVLLVSGVSLDPPVCPPVPLVSLVPLKWCSYSSYGFSVARGRCAPLPWCHGALRPLPL